MDGRDYIKQAEELVETIISNIENVGLLNGDPLIEGARKVCRDLNDVKNKATLRTKAGTQLVFPVLEAARNLEEAWEDARRNNDVEDLKWRLEGFVDAVLALTGALKDRTIIMT